MIKEPFAAKDNAELRLASGSSNHRPRTIKEPRVGGWNLLAEAPVAGHEAFRKADQTSALNSCFGDGLLSQRHRFLRTRGEPKIRQCDSKRVHLVFQIISVVGASDQSGASKARAMLAWCRLVPKRGVFPRRNPSVLLKQRFQRL